MYAGLFALMLVAAIVAVPHALADNSNKTRDSEQKGKSDNEQKGNRDQKKNDNHDEKTRPVPKPIRQVTVAVGVGVGAAVDNDGNLHRSHFRIDLTNAMSTNSTSANSTSTNSTGYQVKKGQLFILEKGRSAFKFIPETWRTDIADGKSSFTATGQVKDSKNTFSVSLTGSKIRDVKNASLYRVDGKMSTNGTEYDLHYISTFSKKNRSVEPLADVPE